MNPSSRLAVVLSGGAALGAFEAGVIDSLASAGVQPSLVVGTSIGALNAAFWAFNPGPNVGRELSAAWHRAPGAHIFPRRRTPVLLRLMHDEALARPVHLEAYLRQIFGPARAIEEAAIPLAIVAVDIVTGEPVVMREGPLIPALMASSAIPGLYPPVTVGDRLLADGGVVANAHLEAVAEAGIRDTVMVDLLSPADRAHLTGARELVEQAVTIALERQTELELRLLRRRMRLVVIRLRLPYQAQPWDFSALDRLLSMGRRSGATVLASHLGAGGVKPGLIESLEPVTWPA